MSQSDIADFRAVKIEFVDIKYMFFADSLRRYIPLLNSTVYKSLAIASSEETRHRKLVHQSSYETFD